MLRTLTLKSQIKFGKFADYTVQQVIQIEKTNYLCWVYYNSSNITFIPEILESLGITYLIAKPGVDKEYWKDNGSQFDKPVEKKEVSIKEAVFFKKKGERTKRSKHLQLNRLTHESKSDLMHRNRTKR